MFENMRENIQSQNVYNDNMYILYTLMQLFFAILKLSEFNKPSLKV